MVIDWSPSGSIGAWSIVYNGRTASLQSSSGYGNPTHRPIDNWLFSETAQASIRKATRGQRRRGSTIVYRILQSIDCLEVEATTNSHGCHSSWSIEKEIEGENRIKGRFEGEQEWSLIFLIVIFDLRIPSLQCSLQWPPLHWKIQEREMIRRRRTM